MLVPDFYPQKVTIVNGLYQSLMVMQQCQGYDLGTGFISESNGAQGVIKRPIKGFDDPITIGWVCQKAHTLSQPAESPAVGGHLAKGADRRMDAGSGTG